MFQALGPCEVHLSGQAPSVLSGGCEKQVILTLCVACGPALRPQSRRLPVWLVGGCTLLGLCRWAGPWPSLRGQHSRTVQRVTWASACDGHPRTDLCLAQAGLPSAPFSICPVLPKSLSVTLGHHSLCDGRAVGDIWTHSDTTVCFSHLCSPGAPAWLPPSRVWPSGPALSREVASGPGDLPAPPGFPVTSAVCFWALGCGDQS